MKYSHRGLAQLCDFRDHNGSHCPTLRGVRSVGISACRFEKFSAPVFSRTEGKVGVSPRSNGMQLVWLRRRLESRQLAGTNEPRTRRGSCPHLRNQQRWGSQLINLDRPKGKAGPAPFSQWRSQFSSTLFLANFAANTWRKLVQKPVGNS